MDAAKVHFDDSDLGKIVADCSRVIIEFKNKKRTGGSEPCVRQYHLSENTGEEMVYRDCEGDRVKHAAKVARGACYLIELEEIGKEPDGLFSVSIYRAKNAPQWAYSSFFDEFVVNAKTRAEAYYNMLKNSGCMPATMWDDSPDPFLAM